MKPVLQKGLILLFWLLLWEAAAALIGNTLLFVGPRTVLRYLIQLGKETAFYWTICHSLGNILAGFFLGLLLGSSLALVTNTSAWLTALFQPLVSMMKVTPVASFTMFVLAFVQSSHLPMIVAFLMVFPVIYGNMQKGLQNVDPALLEMAGIFGFSHWQRLRTIYFPAVYPFFYAAFQTGIGYAWKAGITAEVLVSPLLSIGKNIADAKVYFDTLQLFAWTIVIIAVSIGVEKSLSALLRWLIYPFLFPNKEGEQS
ncbi:ABC transporter permease [Listeria grayi]|uniref:ABC transporter permease n=1 Tax=Listeria grayi TaxID=1641 RepID=UPI001626AA9B|nr:ABC transporter permease subunit [Listeria grayi]MBC1921638.1 ABC transporter permease subunit [Listeria grayi]